MVISYEIYETRRRLVSLISYEITRVRSSIYTVSEHRIYRIRTPYISDMNTVYTVF